jgi:hypothetical protein
LMELFDGRKVFCARMARKKRRRQASGHGSGLRMTLPLGGIGTAPRLGRAGERGRQRVAVHGRGSQLPRTHRASRLSCFCLLLLLAACCVACINALDITHTPLPPSARPALLLQLAGHVGVALSAAGSAGRSLFPVPPSLLPSFPLDADQKSIVRFQNSHIPQFPRSGQAHQPRWARWATWPSCLWGWHQHPRRFCPQR